VLSDSVYVTAAAPAEIIHRSTSMGNGGAGVDAQLRTPEIALLISAHNVGDGLRLVPATINGDARVDSSTLTANGGAGLRVTADRQAFGAVTQVLAADNGGAGIAVPAGFGSVVRNDAWHNAGGDFVNGAELNISADPLFCGAIHGDFHVDAASPCAPTGTFGQIGALGVGCHVLHEAAIVLGSGTVHRGGGGFVEVGLLSTGELDATRIDLASVRLAGATLSSRGQAAKGRDLNHDGLADEVLRFDADALGLSSRDTAATLTATTLAGDPVTATVALRVDGSPKSQLPATQAAPVPVLSMRLASPGIVEFTVPGTEPARLTVLDVAGRSVASFDVPGSTGVQRIDLAATHLRPGFYLARLQEGSDTVRTKLLVLR
jgi:hypothetical protein